MDQTGIDIEFYYCYGWVNGDDMFKPES